MYSFRVKCCVYSRMQAVKSLRNVGVYLREYTPYTLSYNNLQKRVRFKKSLTDLSSVLRHSMQKQTISTNATATAVG